MHKLVVIFNRDILGIPERKLGLMGEDEFKLSLHQLREELDEIEEAYNEGDLVKVVDGLIDLDYFHKGVIYKHGISEPVYEQMFEVVHNANMAKKKGVKESRQGYGDSADAVKPEGWIPPEETLGEIIIGELKAQS